MALSLREIARASGLSTATLSRALSGKGYLSPEMRRKAEDALQNFGYKQPRPRARALSGSGDTLLVITGGLQSGTYIEIIEELSALALQANKHAVTMYTGYDSAREEACLRYAQSHGMWGVVMLSAVETEGIARMLRQVKCPVVLLGRYLPSVPRDIIIQDNYQMGAMAAKRLVQAGHTKIGYLGGHEASSITQDKLTGLMDQLGDMGLSLDPRFLSYGALDYKSGCAYAQRILTMPERPTAVFASNELMAIGVMNTLLRAGYRIPEDMSLICCDRTTACEICYKRLDHMYIDYRQGAQMAMKLISARHLNPTGVYRSITFDPVYEQGQTLAGPAAP